MPTPTVPTDALTTRQKVKDMLNITDTSKDTIIDELITYVTTFIKSFCGGRQFLSASYDEQYDSFRYRRKIFLRQYPVTAVSNVYYRGGTPTNVVWNNYLADGYLPYLNEGYIHFDAQLPKVHLGLRVVYTAGYLIDFTNEFDSTHHTLPEDLTLCATELVVKLLNTGKAMGILEETTEGQGVKYGYKMRELDDMHRNILANYKTFRIAL